MINKNLCECNLKPTTDPDIADFNRSCLIPHFFFCLVNGKHALIGILVEVRIHLWHLVEVRSQKICEIAFASFSETLSLFFKLVNMSIIFFVLIKCAVRIFSEVSFLFIL